MENHASPDRRAVSESRFRFVMIVFAVVWAMQAFMLLGLLYSLTARIERIEQRIGSARVDSKSLPTQTEQ